MNELTITTYPAAILRQAIPDLPREEIDRWQPLAKQMEVVMEKADGIGLAAVQINQAVRLAVIHKNIAQTPEHLWLFNPRLSWSSWRTKEDEEGCLSLPKIFGVVRRPSSIIVKYLRPDGQAADLKAKGLLARAIQHEIDHLDGVLFIDRASKITSGQELLAQWPSTSAS